MLYDFMLLLEKGAFYLAGERMKAPQFFNSIRGKSEVFNEGCRRMGEVLSNRIIGIAAVFFAVLLKRDRPELSMLLSVACGTIIFAFALERLGTTIEFFKGLLSKLPVEPAFFVTMVKMLGIAYIAEFSSSICKDCGHSAIASQIELFAKGAIVVMSIPVMSCLIELIGELF